LLIPRDLLHMPVAHRWPFCRTRLSSRIIPIPKGGGGDADSRH
jgi:hypothetical protein